MQSNDPKKDKLNDDRNLVVVDKDFSEADVEDRLWLFWKRNWVSIIATVLLILVATLGVNAYRAWQQSSIADMQDAYLAATSPEGLAAFAKEYKGEPLAALATLQLADLAYNENRFDDAAALYDEAAKKLPVAQVAQRAQLGKAIALIRAGKDDTAAALTALAQDAKISQGYRAQAAYQLALLALEKKDYAATYGWLDQIMSMPYAGAWAQRAQTLVSVNPEILKTGTAEK